MKLRQKLQKLKRRHSRIVAYILAFFIIMFVTVFVSKTSVIRQIDLYYYGKVYLNPENVGSPENYFKFIDLSGHYSVGTTFPEKVRGKVFQFLNAVDSMTPHNPMEKPPVVMLDVSFNNNSFYLDSIIDAIKRLNAKKIKVYGAYDMPDNGETFQEHDPLQAEDLYYDYFEGGRLHTDVHLVNEYGVVSYKSFIPIMNGPDTVFVRALPIKVINDFTNKRTDDSIRKPTYFTLPITKQFLEHVKNQTYELPSDSQEIKGKKFTDLNASDLSNKILVAGFNATDVQTVKNETIPGPYLVGMAMWNEFNNHKLTKMPYDNEAFHLGLELFCALLVVFIFDLIFKRIRRLRTKTWLIAIISFLIGVSVLYLIGLFLLSSGAVIRPSVSIFSMFWACVLAWHFGIKFMVTGITEGGELYDVFISYSHGDSIWVKQNLFNPLSEIKKPDGSKLHIFFDEKSIGIGELFTTKYMRAIVDSKLFIPVMSEEYYRKNHCRNEMAIAVKRHVEKLIGLCIIALDYKYVPEELTHINYVDINKQTDFIRVLKRELVKEEEKQLHEADKVEKLKSDKAQEQSEKRDTVEHVEIEATELDQKEKKEKAKSKKKKDKKGSKKKDKKKSGKKDKKEDKKKSKKKDKKENKKKSKKKDKKENKKKSKKASKKKDKKEDKKKSKKKDKKERKKKSKKS